MDKFKNAFDSIKATDELKESARVFAQKTLIKRHKTRYTYVATFCSVLILLVLSVVGYSLYSSPVSTISIDVNPSIELQLNVFNRVVSATAYNDDGNLIMNNISVNNMEYTEAVDKILNDKVFLQYISEDSLLVITVASEKKEELIGGIESTPQFTKLSTEQVETEVVEGDEGIIEEAHGCGLSFGKYQAFSELQKLDPTLTEDDAVGMTMREIRDRIAELTDSSTTTENSSVSAEESQCETDSSCEEKGNKSNGAGGGKKGMGYRGGRE